MAKGNVHLDDANFIRIKHIHAEINEPKQKIANMLIAWALNIVETAKEQGLQDKDIVGFIDYVKENGTFNDDINFMAQNFIESKNK